MSTSVTGRVINESNAGIAGLLVVARSESDLFPSVLGMATTDGSGQYTIAVPADRMTDVFGTRQVGVYVRTNVVVQKDANKEPKGRVLCSRTVPDGTGDTLTMQDFVLRDADVTGWPVTLPGSSTALDVRKGNALRFMVDNKVAWDHLAQSLRGAQSEIDIMQLEFDLPKGYNADATQESPEIVLAFPDAFDGDTAPTTANDPQTFPRPERLLLDAATANKKVRVMLPKCGNVIGGLLFAKGAGKLQDYFKSANSKALTQTFVTEGSSVVHAKVALVDAVADAANPEAIILGSPFSQSYYDSGNHAVFEARRGSCSGEPIPVHDVSVAVRGPVVADIQAQFAAHWNKDPKAEQVPLLTAPAELTAANQGEYLASTQIVRTVNYKTLANLDDGEQGCLEAYLRAIEKATDFIYLENQYFTNRAIGDALIGALANQPKLQVILLLNIDADLPFYPTWQANLVGRIRDEAGTAAASRFGVFTAWSHTEPSTTHHRTQPVLIPNYMHTKTAIVDGKWATIGSANLDGASLDEFQLLYPLLGKNRNDEINLLVFNDQPDFPQTDFVDQLRLQLWSEHLGLAVDDPKLSAATLSAGDGGWLKLWTDQATAKLQGLIDDPGTVNPCHVLAFPPDARLDFNPTALPFGLGALLAYFDFRNYLTKSKIADKAVDLSKIDLDATTTSFDFHAGKWADA